MRLYVCANEWMERQRQRNRIQLTMETPGRQNWNLLKKKTDNLFVTSVGEWWIDCHFKNCYKRKHLNNRNWVEEQYSKRTHISWWHHGRCHLEIQLTIKTNEVIHSLEGYTTFIAWDIFVLWNIFQIYLAWISAELNNSQRRWLNVAYALTAHPLATPTGTFLTTSVECGGFEKMFNASSKKKCSRSPFHSKTI